MALRVEVDFPDHSALAGVFEAHRVTLVDQISEFFELSLSLTSEQPDIDPESLLGEKVVVTFRDEFLLPSISGMVSRAQRHTAETTGVTKFDLTVVPFEWLLTRARSTRIFQALSAPDIAASVLKDHGLSISAPAGHPVREVCVQHEETDRDFVFRILAEDGTATFHDPASGKWLLVDDTTSGSIAASASVVFNPSNLTPGGPAVLKWTEMADVETAAVAKRDYDYTKPNFLLQVSETAQNKGNKEASLEDYDYEVGSFAGDGDGKALVKRRLEALRATRRRLRLVTNFAATAGARLSISGADIQGDWVVVRSAVWLESDASGKTETRYELLTIPSSVPFRPRLRPKPRIQGAQTAFVVGDTPAGTVDTDAMGRVKVEFRWDRRDLGKGNPTRWVRVSQAWAGTGFGFVTLPRVGDEVLVAYSEGDPDQPVIVGRVHNAVSVTPLALAEPDKTKSIWKSQSFGSGGPVDGYNMIMMNDAAGEELLEVKAQLDYRTSVGRDMATQVGRNRSTYIEGDDATEIKGNQSLVVHGNSSSKTKGSAGISGGSVNISSGSTLKIQSKGDLTISTEANRADSATGDHTIKAANLYIDVGGGAVEVKAGTVLIEASSEIKLVCGGSSIVLTPGDIKITAGGNVEVNGGLIKLNC
ncbi:MAG: type VI secretion system tip protein VgrG [Polyangiaceae bacterium]|nr:type VI secretion system tip protein VgrG [Polyangiaceae bacterium]